MDGCVRMLKIDLMSGKENCHFIYFTDYLFLFKNKEFFTIFSSLYTISADVYFVYLTDYVRICSLQYIRQKNPTICLQIRLYGMSHRDVPVTVSAQF